MLAGAASQWSTHPELAVGWQAAVSQLRRSGPRACAFPLGCGTVLDTTKLHPCLCPGSVAAGGRPAARGAANSGLPLAWRAASGVRA